MGKLTNQEVITELSLPMKNHTSVLKQSFSKYQDLFKMVANIYSTEPGYKAINNACRQNYLIDVLYTLTAAYQEIGNNKNLMITPGMKLYRGVPSGCEGNQTGYWPSFTSVSTNR